MFNRHHITVRHRLWPTLLFQATTSPIHKTILLVGISQTQATAQMITTQTHTTQMAITLVPVRDLLQNFNPGPKVHQYRHTIPSPSASIFATVISATPLSDPGATSATPFQTFDARAPDVANADPSSHPITWSWSLSIRSNHTSSGSVYSSEASSTCSFYTASADDFELSMDDAQIWMANRQCRKTFKRNVSPTLSPILPMGKLQEDSPFSFVLTPPKPILNDCSDSSGFASTLGSVYGFVSRSGISSSDTEPDLADEKAEESERRKLRITLQNGPLSI